MHWHEDVGPDPLQGAAGQGTNTWTVGVIKYGESVRSVGHDWSDSGGHRRLGDVVPGVVRPVVPAAVQWPAMLEPEFLACGSEGQVAAFTSGGLGALVPAEATSGRGAGSAAPFVLEGLAELGMLRGISWGSSGLFVATGSGALALCPVLAGSETSSCTPVPVPNLPFASTGAPIAAVLESVAANEPLRAAVAAAGGRVLLHELAGTGIDHEWRLTAEVLLPFTAEGQVASPEIVALGSDRGNLLVTTADGSVFQWQLQGGKAVTSASREAPAAGPRRSWRAACALPTGKVMRLASNWRRMAGGATEWQPELLI